VTQSGDVVKEEAETDDSPAALNETAEEPSQKDGDEIEETAEKTEETDKKEAADGNTNEKEAKAGAEETADKKAESDIDKAKKDPAEKAAGGQSKKAKKKAKQKRVMPEEDLVFQTLERVNDMDDAMRIALDDIEAIVSDATWQSRSKNPSSIAIKPSACRDSFVYRYRYSYRH
jgi:hypothetical protein